MLRIPQKNLYCGVSLWTNSSNLLERKPWVDNFWVISEENLESVAYICFILLLSFLLLLIQALVLL